MQQQGVTAMNMTATIQHEGAQHITDVEYFDPDTTLITTLKRAITNTQDILLQLDGGGDLVLLSSVGEYFSRISDEQRFFTAPVSDIQVTVLAKGDHWVHPADAIGRNIDELMWKAAYYSSQGRLMQGCHPVDMVEVDHWPNLSRLPHTGNAHRLIALLYRHPASIGFAARLLKIAPKEVYQLYSAARSAGLAKPINRTLDEPSLEPHRNHSLLSTLLKRISSL
jgi:hypothetical protein